MRGHQANNKTAWSGIALAFLAWLLHPVANAQSDAQILDGVRACQRVPELSFRLACYDRVLPPIVESVDSEDSPAASREPVATATEPARREQAATVAAPAREERIANVAEPSREERVANVAEPEPPRPTTVQIVEVQTPSPGTTRFVAADGRVFVRANATTIHRWPDTPFDVEIQLSRFGTTFLRFPESRLRIRVAVSD